jgi:hypothetical protein
VIFADLIILHNVNEGMRKPTGGCRMMVCKQAGVVRDVFALGPVLRIFETFRLVSEQITGDSFQTFTNTP